MRPALLGPKGDAFKPTDSHRKGEGLPGDEQAYAGNDYAERQQTVGRRFRIQDNVGTNSLTIWVLSSIWNGKNDQPLPGWPTPQNKEHAFGSEGYEGQEPRRRSLRGAYQRQCQERRDHHRGILGWREGDGWFVRLDTTNVASNEWAYAFTNQVLQWC